VKELTEITVDLSTGFIASEEAEDYSFAKIKIHNPNQIYLEIKKDVDGEEENLFVYLDAESTEELMWAMKSMLERSK
jgi:hypothetical protein